VHLAQEAPKGRVARSLGGFTAAVMTGAVCGTAIGAVLADRIGFRFTLTLSMVLVVITALLVWRTFVAGGAGGLKTMGLWRSVRAAFSEPRFALLVLFAAIPAKILLGGFIFFLAPLELREIGLSQAAIGRNVMLYGLCMLPAILAGAWLTDRTGRGGLVIAIAGVANGVALLLPLWLRSCCRRWLWWCRCHGWWPGRPGLAFQPWRLKDFRQARAPGLVSGQAGVDRRWWGQGPGNRSG
jgi:predicted MFS family arabinose efflux permease